ncbi:CubicO group peptidase, beta-lactamase class C family [Asanoa hainanensis]|uniref:CubicO group peptidase, beta-lactamase class C family n=1 Tax=Asanoa hainanensis TaxID=560556 RepID=A0A239PGN4_9ACTN|nr:serine hydrolase domain-containing protein [Asanoa hainanensis]SNT65529.1 CubicO group peptidase, beta-lactamase class C family [Asanoa hainanensis]
MRRLLVFVAAGLIAALPSRVPVESIDDFIDSEMRVSGVPGLAYAAVADGRTTSVGVRGVARRGDDRKITPDTPFLTGSITKSFTALAVMQLVEADKLNVDAEVSHYLDGFSGQPSGAVTIRQLLSHTSGFSTLQGNAPHTDISERPDELARRVDRLADVVPVHPPGERWEYSNTNYQILGRLVEVVSGQQYQDYVALNILKPIGMTHSFVADGEVHESMATGHRPWFGTKISLPDNRTERGTAPQGGIVASAGDLALYLRMMMNGENDVLSAEGKAQMMRPAGETSPFYGLGWFVDPADGRVWHSGTSPGFESIATMIPGRRTGVVVLVNGGSGMGFGETSHLRDGITAAAIGLDYGDEGSRWPRKALFIALVLLPVSYLLSMMWAWVHRAELRAKTGRLGWFSLLFPLLTTAVAAWVILSLMPSLLGSPLGTIRQFQPDVGLALLTSAVTGVLWAGFRLAVARISGHPPPRLSRN